MSVAAVDPRVALGPSLAPGAGTAVVEMLDRLRPVVRVDPRAGEAAALAAATLFSLVVRTHAHGLLDGDAPLGPNPWAVNRLSELPERLGLCRPPAAASPDRELVIAVGPGGGTADLWVGGDDWTARVGHSPQPVGGCNGLGLQAAAVYGAAEALKAALGSHLAHVSAGELVWNLWDYRDQPAPSMDRPEGRSLELVFFGSGSVGSSALGLIGCQAGLTGTADVVDADAFDPQRNPFRYPACTGAETGPKAEWTAGLLRARGWEAQGHVLRASEWVAARSEPGFDGIAVSSVDTVSGRLQVADALASTTLSVGVSGTALHIQREHCFDEWACPHCEFVSAPTPLSQAQVHQQMTGLPLERVAQLHVSGDPLTAEDLARIVGAGKLHAERVSELVGHRLEDLLQRIYAQAVVVGGPAQPESGAVTAVSTPFVSWMGGVLISAELTKAAAGAPMVDRRVDLDLSGVPLGAVGRRSRDRSGCCTCHSPHRQRWANRLYGGERGR